MRRRRATSSCNASQSPSSLIYQAVDPTYVEGLKFCYCTVYRTFALIELAGSRQSNVCTLWPYVLLYRPSSTFHWGISPIPPLIFKGQKVQNMSVFEGSVHNLRSRNRIRRKLGKVNLSKVNRFNVTTKLPEQPQWTTRVNHSEQPEWTTVNNHSEPQWTTTVNHSEQPEWTTVNNQSEPQWTTRVNHSEQPEWTTAAPNNDLTF